MPSLLETTKNILSDAGFTVITRNAASFDIRAGDSFPQVYVNDGGDVNTRGLWLDAVQIMVFLGKFGIDTPEIYNKMQVERIRTLLEQRRNEYNLLYQGRGPLSYDDKTALWVSVINFRQP